MKQNEFIEKRMPQQQRQPVWSRVCHKFDRQFPKSKPYLALFTHLRFRLPGDTYFKTTETCKRVFMVFPSQIQFSPRPYFCWFVLSQKRTKTRAIENGSFPERVVVISGKPSFSIVFSLFMCGRHTKQHEPPLNKNKWRKFTLWTMDVVKRLVIFEGLTIQNIIRLDCFRS